MSEPMFLTFNEVIERYRGQISEGTLRNWPSMRVGPSLLGLVGAAMVILLFETRAGWWSTSEAELPRRSGST